MVWLCTRPVMSIRSRSSSIMLQGSLYMCVCMYACERESVDGTVQASQCSEWWTYTTEVSVSVALTHLARDMASEIFMPNSDRSYFMPILRTLQATHKQQQQQQQRGKVSTMLCPTQATHTHIPIGYLEVAEVGEVLEDKLQVNV